MCSRSVLECGSPLPLSFYKPRSTRLRSGLFAFFLFPFFFHLSRLIFGGFDVSGGLGDLSQAFIKCLFLVEIFRKQVGYIIFLQETRPGSKGSVAGNLVM